MRTFVVDQPRYRATPAHTPAMRRFPRGRYRPCRGGPSPRRTGSCSAIYPAPVETGPDAADAGGTRAGGTRRSSQMGMAAAITAVRAAPATAVVTAIRRTCRMESFASDVAATEGMRPIPPPSPCNVGQSRRAANPSGATTVACGAPGNGRRRARTARSATLPISDWQLRSSDAPWRDLAFQPGDELHIGGVLRPQLRFRTRATSRCCSWCRNTGVSAWLLPVDPLHSDAASP